mgnify:CR=1 FL=1
MPNLLRLTYTILKEDFVITIFLIVFLIYKKSSPLFKISKIAVTVEKYN